MSDPVWKSASDIDDLLAEVRKLVDQAELNPSPTTFQEARLRLNRIEAEAASIMAMSREQYILIPDPALEG